VIEYLEKLVEDQDYQRALAYAEQLLLNPDATPYDMLRVYEQVLKARLESDEFYGAQVAGELALKMAEELNEWDRYGHVALMLGVASDRLRQHDKALECYHDYLSHLTSYTNSSRFEALVLYNIGTIYNISDRREEALRMFRRAEEAANRANNERQAHGIRHALIDAYLRCDKLDEIPPLLAKCAWFLRSHRGVSNWRRSFLWHHILRTRYALGTNRLGRAMKVAERGLVCSASEPEYKHRFHMLIALIHERQQQPVLALEHAMQARVTAIQARRYDLEYDAGLYVYGLLATHSDSVGFSAHRFSEVWDMSLPKFKE